MSATLPGKNPCNPTAVTRTLFDAGEALGARSSLRNEDAARIFAAASDVFSRSFAALKSDRASEDRHTALNSIVAAYCSFLSRAARVTPPAQIAAAADGLIGALISVGVWPSPSVINALLDVTIALRAPAAAARLARALPALDGTPAPAGGGLKPFESVVAALVRANSSPPVAAIDGASLRKCSALFSVSARDAAEASRADAHLLATSRALGVETAAAAEPRSRVALGAILDFICDQNDDVPRDVDVASWSANTPSAADSGAAIEHMTSRLMFAFRLLSECSDFDEGGEMAAKTLTSALQLAALRSWHAKSPSELTVALGHATRADVLRVFNKLAAEQTIWVARGGRAVDVDHPAAGPCVSSWRTGAIDAVESMNAVAASSMAIVAASSSGRVSGARADRAAAILSALRSLGVPPSADVAKRFLRIALSDATPELVGELLRAMRVSHSYPRQTPDDAFFPLSAASASRALAALHDAVREEASEVRTSGGLGVGKPPASVLRAAALSLAHFTRAGAVPDGKFLERLATDATSTWLSATSASCPSCGSVVDAPRPRALDSLAPASPLFRSQRAALEALVSDAARSPAGLSSVTQSAALATVRTLRPSRDPPLDETVAAPSLACASPARDPIAASNAPSRFLDALSAAGLTGMISTRALVKMARATTAVGCGREAWATWRVLRSRVRERDNAVVDASLALALLRVFCLGGTEMAAPAWDVYLKCVQRSPGPLPSFAALSGWVTAAQPPAASGTLHTAVLLADVADKLKGFLKK